MPKHRIELKKTAASLAEAFHLGARSRVPVVVPFISKRFPPEAGLIEDGHGNG